MESSLQLRDHLLKSLSTLPGSCRLAVHLLVTTPRKHLGLYPNSSLPLKSRATVYQQNILALISVSPVNDALDTVFISAIEAALYTTPSLKSSILYISKVDSTGQHASLTSSPTRRFVVSFLEFFASPETRTTPHLRIQLFARAQSQYLFPNSSQFSGKRVLSDAKLCKWWKDVFSEVVAKTTTSLTTHNHARPFFLLPGFSKDEVENMLRSVSDNSGWEYGHPYDLPAIRYYNAFTSTSPESDTSFPPYDLFDVIPTFSDDPKARFMVEIAATTKLDNKTGEETPKSPAKKRVKMDHGSRDESGSGHGGSRVGEGDEETNPLPSDSEKPRQLISVSMSEFWERMGFRQECSQGAVTGFFVVDFQLSSWSEPGSSSIPTVTKPHPSQVSSTLHARILASLLNLDFGSTDRAKEATRLLLESIKGLVYGAKAEEIGSSDLLPEGPNLETNAGATTLDVGTGASDFITASIILDNVPLQTTVDSSFISENPPAPSANPVNVLQPRKKKRPAP